MSMDVSGAGDYHELGPRQWRSEIDLGPDRLVVGSDRLLVDPSAADAAGEAGADEAVVDAVPGAESAAVARYAFALAVAGGDPGIDEPLGIVHPAEAGRHRPDDPVIERRAR